MTPEEAARRLAQFDAFKLALMPRVVLIPEGNVKKRTPVRTGHLRRSINSRVEGAGERGVAGTNVIYARPVNARRQFMEQGLEDSIPAIEQLAARMGGEFFAGVAG